LTRPYSWAPRKVTMKHKLDFDLFIQQAISDAFGCYTIIHTPKESNLDRVASLAAVDLIKNWSPELAATFKEAIKAEMETQLEGLFHSD
jgi:hypothetical protein